MIFAIGILQTVMALAGDWCDDATSRRYCNEARSCCGWVIPIDYPDKTPYDMVPRKCSGP